MKLFVLFAQRKPKQVSPNSKRRRKPTYTVPNDLVSRKEMLNRVHVLKVGFCYETKLILNCFD